ncbi:uncharacterized protein [Clytia hemisphaerica]|uniref:Uncharacterized protein n=1 Tax=Clytia hemisphaerica TaxID=252671 RepID=A0A7M5X3X2_9CNID|eukprot:TCONS_00039314-protein
MIMLSLVILSMATLVPHFCEARRYPHRHSVMKDVGFIDPVIPSCRPGDTLDEKMAGIEWKFGRCNKEVDNVYYKRRSRKCKDEPDDKCIPKPGTGVLGLGGPVSPESSGKDCDVLQEQSILSACDCSEMKPLEWGAWTCVSEYRHRSRRCGLKEGTDKCSYKRCDGKSLKEETIDCDFCGKTRNWEAWGEWGDCDLKGYRHRSRTCEYNDPELKCDDKHNCKSDESRQKKFFPTCCRERNWESWGPWGKCDSEGYIHRQRKCEPKDPESECDKSTCKEGEDGEKKRNIEKCCAPR